MENMTIFRSPSLTSGHCALGLKPADRIRYNCAENERGKELREVLGLQCMEFSCPKVPSYFSNNEILGSTFPGLITLC